MPSTGPNNPGTAANDTTVGTIAWTNPSNANAQDDVFATATFTGAQQTNYLKVTNFSFAIPTNATIDGIVVEVDRSKIGVSNVSDTAIRIVKGGTIGATDRSAGGNWGADTDTYTTYGSSTDLWGETWTESDIEESTFGFVMSGTATGASTGQADHIRITVYYTEAATAARSISQRSLHKVG